MFSHYDYGVIDHDCNREHECGKGKQVDGKSEYIHQEECTDQGNRDRDNRYKSRAEILKEALVSISLVMMLVFIPVSFMGGTTGVFYRQFGRFFILFLMRLEEERAESGRKGKRVDCRKTD